MLEKLFHIQANHSTLFREVLAGVTTFFALSYIIFMQPAILSGNMTGNPTGMDFGDLSIATVLAAALTTASMGLYANLPVALAPGMGQNFFFVFSVIPAVALTGHPEPWKGALGAVFLSGILFFLLSLLGFRQVISRAVSPALRHGIGAGIGLFIAFLGLRNAGLIQGSGGSLVTLSDHPISLHSIVFIIGLLGTLAAMQHRIPGGILLGILLAYGASLILPFFITGGSPGDPAGPMKFPGSHLPDQIFAIPVFSSHLFGAFHLEEILQFSMIPVILILIFMDLFDTTGTLIAVREEMRENVEQEGTEIAEDIEGEGNLEKDDRMQRAYLVDAGGTVFGSLIGTSTVTSYIESVTGIEQGGRTGLTALVTAMLFLLSIFFLPLVESVGTDPAVTSAALVLTGALMMRNVARIPWNDLAEAFPAFLVIIGIPLTFSIGDGIALGLLFYPLTGLVAGRIRKIEPASWLLGGLILLYFVFLK